jgi:hypothetical protein
MEKPTSMIVSGGWNASFSNPIRGSRGEGIDLRRVGAIAVGNTVEHISPTWWMHAPVAAKYINIVEVMTKNYLISLETTCNTCIEIR